MTTASAIPARGHRGSEALRAKWRWIVALGIVYVLAGLIALSSVALAAVAKVVVVGVMMLVAGASEIVNAFQVKSWSKFLLWALLGALYVVAGVLTFENPFLAAKVLTLVLGAVLVVSGTTRVVLAASMKDGPHWTWVVLSGVATLFLGVAMLAHWLIGSSVYVLGLFLGIDLIVVGVSWVRLGLDLQDR